MAQRVFSAEREATARISQNADSRPAPSYKTFIIAFDSCLDTNFDGHCMSRQNLAQMVKAKYGGLTNKTGLGSQITDTLPPKPNESFEKRWRLYIYCAPCTQALDLALCIDGHIVGFRAIVRVDDRLQPQCCESGDVLDKLTSFSTLYSEIQREWRIEKNYERSWISSSIDLPWLQRRIRHMKEDENPSSKGSMETYFTQAQNDHSCAAIIILASAKSCAALLEPLPDENGKTPLVESGDIFELQYRGQDPERPWVSSFFGTID